MMARRVLLIVGLGLLGVLAAASIGYASYLVSRDDVGLPVTKLEQAPRDVVPTEARTQTEQRTTSTRTATVDDRLDRGLIPPTTTGDDNSGRGGGDDDNSGKGSSGSGSGSGSDNSGKGSSGGGGDYDDD
jgi:hypothetical protein